MGLFTRFILKYGPGSPGQTAKVMVNRFKKVSAVDYGSFWRDYLMQLAMIRHEACLANPLGYREDQTYLNAVTEERWNELIEQTKGSMAVFIFILMYFETKTFRNAVSENKGQSNEQLKENRAVILKTIYDVINRRSYNNSLSFQESLEVLDNIGGCYYFSISTSLAKTA